MAGNGLPVVITRMSEVPLGLIVERLTKEFDESEEVRVRVIRNTFAFSTYALGLEETREIIGGRTKLSEFAGPIWHREMQIGYLDFLELVTRKLSGQQIESVATQEDRERISKLEVIIDLWRTNLSFMLVVKNLKKAIAKAVEWFNMQQLNIWLEKARYIRPDFDEKLEDISIPYCELIFQDDTYGQQQYLIDNYCYTMGNRIVNSVVVRAYDSLTSQDAPQSLKDLFTVTEEDLAKFALARRGYDPSVIDKRNAKRKKEESKREVEESSLTGDELLSAWKETHGGIIIPKTTKL